MTVSTGVAGLDAVLNGGLPSGRLHVVSGPPGSGKTTLSAQFITDGARRDETCLYVTMHETKRELVADMSSFSFGFDRAVSAGKVRFLDLTDEESRRALGQYGVEGGLTNRLAALIEETNVDRAVVDSTMLLKQFVEDPETEIIDFLTALKSTDATVLLISEMTDPTAYADEHFLAHGVVFFHNFLKTSGMIRAVQVIKMRGTAIDCDMRKVAFGDEGLVVYPETKVNE
jgi:KaiC/GvpD/RAD55 family RecA-like ATPase